MVPTPERRVKLVAELRPCVVTKAEVARIEGNDQVGVAVFPRRAYAVPNNELEDAFAIDIRSSGPSTMIRFCRRPH
jgi:hypothetical protein